MDFYGHRIGETPFYLEEALMDRLSDIKRPGSGVPRIYPKDEADNPSGGHKARVVAPAIERVIKAYPDREKIITRITEGGFPITFGYLVEFAPDDVMFASVVDKSLPSDKLEQLRRYGPVVRTDLDSGRLTSSQIADLVRKKAGRRSAVVIPIDNLDIDGEGYEAAGVELYDSGVRRNWTLYGPLGGANTAVGVTRGFEKKGEVPRMKWATIPGNLFSDVPENGHGAKTHLHARYSGVEREMRRIMKEHDVEIVTIYDEENEEALKVLQGVGLRVCETSSIPWAAIERHAREGRFRDNEPVVFLNTGYQIPPAIAETGHWLRYAAALAAAATFLPVAASVVVPRNVPQAVIDEGSARRYVEGERKELVGNPTMAEIEAFASYKGTTEKLADGRVVNVPNGKVRGDLDYWFNSQDMVAHQMYQKEDSQFRQNIDEFTEWRKINRILQSRERTPEDEKFFRQQLEAAVLHEVDGSPDARLPADRRFMLDYLERDMFLKDKIRFARERTNGTGQEFARIVADLHKPGFDEESMNCSETDTCTKTRSEYAEWMRDQARKQEERPPITTYEAVFRQLRGRQ